MSQSAMYELEECTTNEYSLRLERMTVRYLVRESAEADFDGRVPRIRREGGALRLYWLNSEERQLLSAVEANPLLPGGE